MHLPIASAHNEHGLAPSAGAPGLGQILASNHCENPEKRGLAFLQCDVTLAYDRQPMGLRRVDHSLLLLRRIHREHARKPPAGAQVAGRDLAIIRDGPTHLETTRDLLWMVAEDSRARRKVRRASCDQIKLLVGLQNARLAKISLPKLEAIFKTIIRDRLACKAKTFFLSLDRHETSSRKAPRSNHGDSSKPAP